MPYRLPQGKRIARDAFLESLRTRRKFSSQLPRRPLRRSRSTGRAWMVTARRWILSAFELGLSAARVERRIFAGNRFRRGPLWAAFVAPCCKSFFAFREPHYSYEFSFAIGRCESCWCLELHNQLP